MICIFPNLNSSSSGCQILAKGELQVSKEEREAQLSGLFREVATIVADKCVNPDTQRPYTVSQIERAMKDLHFNLNPAHAAKSQALELIRKLQETIPIQRARMSVRIMLPAKDGKRIKADVLAHVESVENESFDDALELVSSSRRMRRASQTGGMTDADASYPSFSRSAQ